MIESPQSSRDELFARVHAALGRGRTPSAVPAAPTVDESIARLAGGDDDLTAMFHARAAAVGMHVHRLSASEVVGRIVELLTAEGAKDVVLGAPPHCDGLAEALREANIAIVDWRASPGLDVQFDAAAGVTGVAAAIAESGTLIVESDALNSRGLSLVPPLHIAIVRERDILPDMIDYWSRKRGIPAAELPSNFVFITGPSKTADIEGELVTGVHGPEAVHILLVDGT